MWLLFSSLNSGFCPVSNSTTRRGKTVAVLALENKPKYWLDNAAGGEVVLHRTKARPKPGLLGTSGKMEKMKEVEKEVMFEELEEGFMGSLVW